MLGEVPRWYSVIQAARYLGVPPWVLMEQPREWYEMALTAEAAEEYAKAEARKRAAKKK